MSTDSSLSSNFLLQLPFSELHCTFFFQLLYNHHHTRSATITIITHNSITPWSSPPASSVSTQRPRFTSLWKKKPAKNPPPQRIQQSMETTNNPNHQTPRLAGSEDSVAKVTTTTNSKYQDWGWGGARSRRWWNSALEMDQRSLSQLQRKREEENKRNKICGSFLVLVDPWTSRGRFAA